MARVPLLAPEDPPAEHRAFVEGLDAQGAYINIYRAMAHSPVALRRFLDLASSLWGGVLTPRLREIAILTVVSGSDAPYPLGWHILDAADAGVTPPEIQSIVDDEASTLLPPEEAAVARFAREITLIARVSDDTFQGVADFLGEQQIVELTMLCGGIAWSPPS